MASIFISYSRSNIPQVNGLVENLETGGHEVWYDQELTGGQRWWDEVLRQIRESDVFLPVLSPQFVDSVPCRRELEYAAGLNKPLLPVQVDSVSARLLPPSIAEAQWVDYRSPGVQSALLLIRAVHSVGAAPALPDPLPDPPAVPISYLDQLTKLLESEQLTRDEQLRLVADLRDRLGGEEEADALVLFQRFRRRPDLLASTARDIDRILANTSDPPEVATPPVRETSPSATPPMASPIAAASPVMAAPVQAQSASVTTSREAVTERPNNYMVWSIVGAVVFFLAGFGNVDFFLALLPMIPTFIFAAQVNSKHANGDVMGAKSASGNAKRWLIISAGVFGFLFVLYVVNQNYLLY